MRILSLDEAAIVLRTHSMESFIGGIDWQYPDPIPSYFLPKDPGPQIGLARIIANTFLDRGPTVLWVTEFGIWEQHMDLFHRYRLSYGETRTITEAPVHLFDPMEDRDALISILCLCFFFFWGFEITTCDRTIAMTISHDEWLEYRFAPGQEDFSSYFDKWVQPALKQASALKE